MTGEPQEVNMQKRLYRSRSERMIWGVCGGIANYFDIDPTIVRLIAVLLGVLTNLVAVIAYIVLAIVIPLEGSKTTTPKEAVRENVAEMRESASQLGRDISSSFSKEGAGSGGVAKSRPRNQIILGIVLVALGILFLLVNFGWFWWLRWGNVWPVILIVVGLIVVLYARRR